MLHVYKRSTEPMRPWDVMRHGGLNNIAPDVKHKFLVLWNADVVRKEAMWHYVFEFDTRDSLEISELAQIFAGANSSTPTRYPEGADWRTWLGQDWVIIDNRQRQEIMKTHGRGQAGEVVITTLRVGSSQFPLRQ